MLVVRGVGDGGRQHEEDVDEGGHGEAEHESGGEEIYDEALQSLRGGETLIF